MQALEPGGLHPPFGRYSHGILAPAGRCLLATSGQLGIAASGVIPEDAAEQAQLCFAAIAAILAEAGGSPGDIIRLNAFVTDRAHMRAYMAARDSFLADVRPLPASTLVIVSGFTRPEFKVEVEALAAVAAPR